MTFPLISDKGHTIIDPHSFFSVGGFLDILCEDGLMTHPPLSSYTQIEDLNISWDSAGFL